MIELTLVGASVVALAVFTYLKLVNNFFRFQSGSMRGVAVSHTQASRFLVTISKLRTLSSARYRLRSVSNSA